MLKILAGSVLYRLLAAVWAWFGSQWRSSGIVTRFLTPGNARTASDSSVFTRLWTLFHRGLHKVFKKLRLDKLLRGSIFTQPYIWTFLSLILAPFLPTMALLALSLISAASLLLAFGCDGERKLSFSPVNKFILLYAFVYIVAIFTSVTVSGSLYGGALTALFVLFALVLQNSVATRRGLDNMIRAFVISGALVAAYGIYQYLFGVSGASSWIDSEMFSGIGVRVYSTLDNPNMLAEYLLLVIPFAGALAVTEKKPLAKLFFLGCLAAALLCMLFTSARGGWLGLIAAAALYLVLIDRRFIILGIVGVAALYFILPDVFLDRFLSIGNLGDTSTAYRLSIWLGSIAMLRDYWFTGVGPGTAAFNKVYPLYSYNTAAAQHSHNLYLQIMCDAGVCGIVLFVLILFSYFRSLCSAMSRERDKRSRLMQIAAVSSVFGFLVQGATDYSFYNYRVTLVFWAVLGLGAVIARRSSLSETSGEVTPVD